MISENSNSSELDAETVKTEAKIQETSVIDTSLEVSKETNNEDVSKVEMNAKESEVIQDSLGLAENSAEEKSLNVNEDDVRAEDVANLSKEENGDTISEESLATEPVVVEVQTEAKPEQKLDEVAVPVVNFDEVLAELQTFKDESKVIQITIDEKVRGGFRTRYKDCPLFLPVSHFSYERNPSDKELDDAVGKTIDVVVFDIKKETKTVILSRKVLLESKIWEKIKVGDKVEGIVTSTPNFGLFLDLGGVEGLIHISRLTNTHINHPNQIAKKGDKLEAIVLEVSKEKNRIALSRQELEPNAWEGIDSEIAVNSVQKGIVRKVTNFGAYVEIKPGVDGILRTGEMSWTKRVTNLSDVLKVGQKIDVYINGLNIEKKNLTLSIKRMTNNPWVELESSLPLESIHSATVAIINEKGVILTLENDIDGFMPRSKLRPIMEGNIVPYNLGDKVEVKITEIIPDQESLILSPNIEKEVIEKYNKSQENRRSRGRDNKGRDRYRDRDNKRQDGGNVKVPKVENSNFSFGDLLNTDSIEKLSKIK